jgi:hypothetical protein
MVALAERLRLELDSSDRKNLVGRQITPDKSHNRPCSYYNLLFREGGFTSPRDAEHR